jgi:hypothetical protein
MRGSARTKKESEAEQVKKTTRKERSEIQERATFIAIVIFRRYGAESDGLSRDVLELRSGRKQMNRRSKTEGTV